MVASFSSFPAKTSKIKALSSTVLVIGPGESKDEPIAITPYLLTLPYVGFSPTTPHQLAGCLIEPAVSEPIAAMTSSAATAAADPPEEPPGRWFMFQGFLVGPKSEVSVEDP